MNWPWVIRDVPDMEKLHRRVLLDRYGLYAQLSALVPIAAYWLYRLAIWVVHERQRAKPEYTSVPSSPGTKQAEATKVGRIEKKWRILRWWLEGESFGYGKRIHLLAGLAWAAWLVFLSVHRTGDDYFHVTKRFGIVAVSQFPLHYALIMKHGYSPLALLFRTSHESLNPFHRALGRVIFFLLYIHAGLYINYYLRVGLLTAKFSQLVPLLGLVAFAALNLLGTTSLDKVRHWNYRVFFLLHMSIGLGIIPILFFHAPSLRFYVIEALVLFFIDIAVRRSTFITEPTRISAIPDSNLLQLSVPIPTSLCKRFADAAGAHVFLSIPSSSRPTTSAAFIHEFCFNPFTIATVAPDGQSLTLVLRVLSGPTSSSLNRLVALHKANPPLTIDGPYGGSSSPRLHNLARDYDRVLMIAGGVGATFVLPLYRKVKRDVERHSKGNVRMVWSMRSLAEAAWAIDASTVPDAAPSRTGSATPASFRATAESLSEKEDIELFVTGLENADSAPSDGSVELVDLLKESLKDELDEAIPAEVKKGRPELTRIVDETFRMGHCERVAVVICGPRDMGRELREAVGKWVGKGRDVWWHEEAFGW